ncbi:transglycosylase SLT domain-containing protein [Buchnera aphidicola]|uniref:peptidoglycan lytic exotransglycosylase n=1 Tax=Buchnera aphidicola (Artemisaphis artemisicola) TaxID=1241836 RepID=A0A4D6XHM2_9GAMM|nr:transglycosylase SLT domain-containing protein [Buchnera aphidicola]QCI15942.1 murein transglycosylase [Buchnera aphidicola (Artemisaphis artemisicola)]
MKLGIIIISIILLTGFNKFLHTESNLKMNYSITKKSIEKKLYKWNSFIEEASQKYKVDKKLIQSIIYVESSGNPNAKSSSNAIGLMQIKPSSAGLEVYRFYGKKNQPSIEELYNPQNNINIGTAYLNILQKSLINIKNKDIMKYATIISYVNGKSAFLKIFAKNNKEAIAIINQMTLKSFFSYVKKNIQQNKHFLI